MRFALVLALAAAGCGGSGDDAQPDAGSAAAYVMMDYTRPTSLFDAPFPSDDLRTPSGVDVSLFPNPNSVTIVEQVRALLSRARGFATSGGVFFQLSAPIDVTALPDVATSVTAESAVFLIGIDRDAPDFGRRYPLDVTFQPFGGSFSVDNLIAMLPVQGVPLRRDTRYAAVVTTRVLDVDGRALAALAADRLPPHADVIDELAELGVSVDDLAGLTVFTTGDPTAELSAAREVALDRALPEPEQPFTRTELFDDFCAYHTTIRIPDWQSGESPYQTEGGVWTFDGDDQLIFQREAESNLVITVPRSPMPQAGYPLVVFIRVGGGGDRPLVDRGRRAEPGGASIEPGEGPARYFARAGFAGLQVDGPLGGLRNVTGGNEQFLTFNIQNLGAMRDNIREAALETVVIAHVAAALHMSAVDCPPVGGDGPGPDDVWFDSEHFVVSGHSMGAWIAPLAAAVEPMYRAMVLSGAGGSWIENIMYKKKPLEPKPVISLLLNEGFFLTADNPVMSLAQWALEPADPQVYGDLAAQSAGATAPRHILMVQGIVDNYLLPRIASSLSLSMGLDLAGPELDDRDDPRLADQRPVAPLLPLVGREKIPLPASGNTGNGATTAVVVQHLEDGIEDGHEVFFQTELPKVQYQAFLTTWLADGIPTVPGAD